MDWSNSQPPAPKEVLYERDLRTTWVGLKSTSCGLFNLGLTCYLNSSVQALMHCPSFVDYLIHDADHRAKCLVTLECVLCCLHRTYVSMSLHRNYRPFSLRYVLSRLMPQLVKSEQEDAHEFMVALIDLVEAKELEAKGITLQQDYCTMQTTAMGQVFRWWMKTVDTCLDCNFMRCTFSPVSMMGLAVKNYSVQEAITEYCNVTQEIEGYMCPYKCTKKVCTRQTFLHSYPKVLRVVLNRFDENKSKVELPMKVDKTVQIGDATYNLSACVIHLGSSVKQGHYTCIGVQPDGKLLYFDDSTVSPGSEKLTSQDTERGVYIVLYQLHHVKSHSVKRTLPITPSKSPHSSKKLHSSPVKSIEKRKTGNFSITSKKFKLKVGRLMKTVLPCNTKKVEVDLDLAEPLPNILDGEENVVSPLVIRRRVRLSPKAFSSQSSHEYSIVGTRENDASSETTITAIVSPLQIRRRQLFQEHQLPRSQEVGEAVEAAPCSPDLFQDLDGTEGRPLCSPELQEAVNEADDLIPNELTQSIHSLADNVVSLNIVSPPPYTPIVLTANDVPDAALPQPIVEKNTVPQLKRWLQLRGIPVTGKKKELVDRVRNCIAMNTDTVLDPKADGGAHYNRKQSRLILTQEVAQMREDQIFPPCRWEFFPSRDIPSNFNFGSVYSYLVETMPQMEDVSETSTESSSDEEYVEEVELPDPFEESENEEIQYCKKLRRGLQYVKSGYVRDVMDCWPDRLHLYKGNVKSSMGNKLHPVKVALSQTSGSVMKCTCDCRQRALGRCSHILWKFPGTWRTLHSGGVVVAMGAAVNFCDTGIHYSMLEKLRMVRTRG